MQEPLDKFRSFSIHGSDKLPNKHSLLYLGTHIHLMQGHIT